MKENFIELTSTTDEKVLVNMSNVNFIKREQNHTTLRFNGGDILFLYVKETPDAICQKIRTCV